jgi:hypothetical protein
MNPQQKPAYDVVATFTGLVALVHPYPTKTLLLDPLDAVALGSQLIEAANLVVMDQDATPGTGNSIK